MSPDIQLFRDAFNASPIGIAVENLEGQPVFVNSAFCSFLGFSEEELCRKHCVDFSPPEDAAKDWALFQQLRAGSIDHYRLKKRYFRRDAAVVWGRLSVSLMKSRPSPLVIAMIEDITEEKKGEEALHESEERLRLAVQAGKMFAYSWDLATDVIERSGESAEILGVKSDQAATGAAISAMVHPDDKQRLEAALSNLKVENPTLQIAYRIVRPDGVITWLERNSRAYFDEQGKLKRIVGMIADVSERKRAEELRIRLAAIIESSEDAIASATLDGIIVSWNTGAQHMYGYTEAEAVGKPTTILAPPELPDQQRKILETLKLGGRIEQLETVRVTKTGKRINVSLSISPIKDSSGTIVGAAGIARDITERKMAEEKLREYEKAVEGAEDMIGVVDREYRFLLANRQYLRTRNLTREQVVGHFIPEVLGTEIFETVIKPKLDECFQGKVVTYEMKFSYPTVGERDLSLSYFPIEGVNGVDRAACILRDITDRKRAEEELLEMNRALEAHSSLLRSREELLKTFVKNVPAAVAMLDREMRYIQVSDRWCTDYLGGIEWVVGRSHYEIFPDMPERWKEVHRRGLQGETLRADEDRWDRQDGPHWARWEVRPWNTPEGTVGGILILAEDITRRKQMEETLSRLTRRLIESQEQERIRIGRDLHDDFAQRLAMLSIQLERLREHPSEIQNRVPELQKQTYEISHDLELLSHELHSSKMEYLGVAAGIRSWCREFGERQNMEVEFKSDVTSVLPFEVGVCLLRVLQEALHNAAKHSGVKQIEVQLSEHANEVHLIVSDSGRGFDVAAALQGHGLGLTSMRERIRLINGTIMIDSKLTGGTTIHVRAPVQSEHYAQGPVSKTSV